MKIFKLKTAVACYAILFSVFANLATASTFEESQGKSLPENAKGIAPLAADKTYFMNMLDSIQGSCVEPDGTLDNTRVLRVMQDAMVSYRGNSDVENALINIAMTENLPILEMNAIFQYLADSGSPQSEKALQNIDKWSGVLAMNRIPDHVPTKLRKLAWRSQYDDIRFALRSVVDEFGSDKLKSMMNAKK